ncbi:MAG: V-type ATPase subunit [Aigarchaeota archaeon]|nr:V-type ATPase subunit [Aigarchaeota archaeon]MDW8092680.1 V-type ATPase subunit [Nitrososphaerota archaeon]
MKPLSRAIRVTGSYTIAKGFGEKGKLLKRQFLEELADLKDLAEFVNALRNTTYSEYLATIAPPFDPVRLGNVIRRALIELHYRLRLLIQPPSLLDAMYLRYVGRNLKTVLRGLAIKMGYQQLSEIIDLRAEELVGMRDVVIKALSSESLSEAIESLSRTMFGKAVTSAYQLYERIKDPVVFDVEIDRYVMNEMGRGLKEVKGGERKLLTHLLQPMVDGFIITGILRAKLWGLQISEINRLVGEIETTLPRTLIKSLIDANTYDDTVSMLSNVRRLRDSVSVSGSPESVIKSLESTFRNLMIERAERSYLRLGAPQTVAVATVILKEREVNNLSVIATGLSERLPPNVIIEKLT